MEKISTCISNLLLLINSLIVNTVNKLHIMIYYCPYSNKVYSCETKQVVLWVMEPPFITVNYKDCYHVAGIMDLPTRVPITMSMNRDPFHVTGSDSIPPTSCYFRVLFCSFHSSCTMMSNYSEPAPSIKTLMIQLLLTFLENLPHECWNEQTKETNDGNLHGLTSL